MRALVLLVFLVCACSREFDPALRDEGVATAGNAVEVCQDNTPDDVTEPLLLATPTTAGEVTEEARADLGRPIPPWDSLPTEHFVAKCNYGHDPDGEVTTYLVDDAGRSSRDEAPVATRL